MLQGILKHKTILKASHLAMILGPKICLRYIIHLLHPGKWKEFERLNGILEPNSVLSPPLNAVALTKPGAVRPDLSNEA